jgi:hypothetical protein
LHPTQTSTPATQGEGKLYLAPQLYKPLPSTQQNKDATSNNRLIGNLLRQYISLSGFSVFEGKQLCTTDAL